MDKTYDRNLNGKLRLLYEERRYGTKGKPKETSDGVNYQLYECAMETNNLDKENKLVEPLHFRRANQDNHQDCKRLSEK